MTPYETAWNLYHRDGPPRYPWATAIGILFQYGAIISTEDCFIAARKIKVDAPDEDHRRLSPLQSPPYADCWNIWIAAGRLTALLELGPGYALPWVSYFRRGDSRLRRVATSAFLLRYDLAKNAAPAPAAAPASDPARA